MGIRFITGYIVVSIWLAFLNLYFARRAFKRPGEAARYLGYSAVLAMVVNISYLGSILTRDYFQASLMSSVYFIAIDWMLITLLHFVLLFTETTSHRYYRWIRQGIRVYGFFDTLVLAVNVFYELAVHYVDRGTPIAPFTYEMKPLYSMHLVFTYCIVVLVLFILIRKILTTPRQYRNQYAFLVYAILLVVATNAMFLFRDSGELYTLLDFSILGYSVGLYLMCWSAFDYREKNMLESLTMMIFSNLDQGIVLFDYGGRLIMYNRMSEQLLRDVKFLDRMEIRAFQEACDLPTDRAEDAYTVQKSPLRCDFRRMRDQDEEVIGNLYVFSDLSNTADSMTGFMVWEKFRRYAMENPGKFSVPTAVALFDIIGLDQVNRTFGREVGDMRIRNLAQSMRAHLPEGTLFVRGYEAHLVAVCHGMEEEELRGCAEKVIAHCGETVKYGLSATGVERSGEGRDVLGAVETASRAMQVKKLLDDHSAHSQTLSSLVRALEESDSETEAHVRRTQKMGEMLGRRIGLNDAELSDLQLLCLLHDIGKVGIPLEILNKPGRLTEAEWSVLRSHTEKGYQIASSSDELRAIAPMILCHHERWDGKGYPQGLVGTNIPRLSRVIAVVDTYDAMVNDRPYRKARTPQEAMEEMERGSGTQFDPTMVRVFVEMLREHPELAKGENIGGEEPRTIEAVREEKPSGAGSTFAIPYCRYFLDVDDYIVEVDQNFETVTGYTGYDVLNRRMTQYDLIPPEEKADYMIQVNNQFAKGNIAYLEHDIQRKDGTRTRICCMGKRYFDSAVKAFRSEIVVFDIDDRRRGE